MTVPCVYLCVLNSPLQSGGRQDRFRMWSGLVLKLLGGMDDLIYHPHLHCVAQLAHPRAPHSLLQSRVMRMNELGICILLVILVTWQTKPTKTRTASNKSELTQKKTIDRLTSDRGDVRRSLNVERYHSSEKLMRRILELCFCGNPKRCVCKRRTEFPRRREAFLYQCRCEFLSRRKIDGDSTPKWLPATFRSELS